MTNEEIKDGQDTLNLLKEVLKAPEFVNMVNNFRNEICEWLVLTENKLTDGTADGDPLDLFMAMTSIKSSLDKLVVNQHYIKAIMFHEAQKLEGEK